MGEIYRSFYKKKDFSQLLSTYIDNNRGRSKTSRHPCQGLCQKMERETHEDEHLGHASTVRPGHWLPRQRQKRRDLWIDARRASQG